MKDYIRENLSYPGLYLSICRVKREVTPVCVHFGEDSSQYFLYYEPKVPVSRKIIFWVHGGGWYSKSPKQFDYVGQCAAKEGYRLISAGYRHSPKYKYPCQIEDVCRCYNAAVKYLGNRGVDTSQIVLSGPSAGAHLSSLLCYSRTVQQKYGTDLSDVIGYVGTGGPYTFGKDQTLTMRFLEDMLFKKGFRRRDAEPLSLMSESNIPMLLIQSRHDGLIRFNCAEDFKAKADSLGIPCELYAVTDRHNTHSWYTAGMFTQSRSDCKALDKFFTWIGEL